MVKLNSEQLKPIESRNLESSERIEITKILSSDYVCSESIQLIGDDLKFVVLVELIYPIPAVAELDLAHPEPIAIVYEKGKVGLLAPKLKSERKDFPRDLPHLNAVTDEEPVCFCVTRSDLNAFYNAFGIEGFVKQLANWFKDAVAGRLLIDGWEPYPRPTPNLCIFDGKYLQEKATARTKSLSTCIKGLARIIAPAKDCVCALVTDFECEMFQVNTAKQNGIPFLSAPWLYLAPRQANVIEKHGSTKIDSAEELYALLESMELAGSFRGEITRAENRQNGVFKNGLVLIIGVRRPLEIIKEIPGLSDGEARKIELLTYLVTWEKGVFDSESFKVQGLAHVASSNAELFNSVSGYRKEENQILLLGCGALGSQVASNLARSGSSLKSVVDIQLFQPHNAARHALTPEFVLVPKATALAEHLNRIHNTQSTESCNGIIVDITKLDTKNPEKNPENLDLDDYNFIIDATADPLVRNFLCTFPLSEDTKLLRCEISNTQRFSIVSVEGANRNPRFDDLYAYMGIIALNEEQVSKWLTQEDKGEEMLVGLGCASLSTKMPNSTVAFHSAAASTFIEQSLRTKDIDFSGVRVFTTDSDFLPSTNLVIGVDAFEIHGKSTHCEYEVRFSQEVAAKIAGVFADNQVTECGGFLYGRWDTKLEVVTVVFATGAASGAYESVTSLILPPAGESEEEKELLRKCGSHLLPIGTWHSHLNGSSQASAIDLVTLDEMANDSLAHPRPAIILIISSEGIRAYSAVPHSW